jgi:hypothetical protein
VVIQHSNKAARFISSGINGQNVELRFSGSFALHPQIRSAMLSSRRSALDIHLARPSIRTTTAERVRLLVMRTAMRNSSAARRTASQGITSKRSASRSSDQEVMRHLSRSQIFKDYERAFSAAMGLPLNIRGHDSWSPAHHGKEDLDSLASILTTRNTKPELDYDAVGSELAGTAPPSLSQSRNASSSSVSSTG